MERNIKWVFLNIVILFSFQSFSQTVKKSSEIILNSINQPLRIVLDDISIQSGYNFIYSDNIVAKIMMDCSIKNETVEDALNMILRRYDISYKIFDEKNIVLYKKIKSKKEFYKAIVLDKNESAAGSLRFLVKPTLINKNTLEYPPEAVRNKIEGKTIVKFLIDGFGDVSNALIESSSGYNVLDSTSIKYARELKFIPAEANGRTQNVWMTMEFRYTITKN